MSAVRPEADEVEREMLDLVFQSAPRALMTGFLFACIAAYIVRERLSPPVLVGWLVAFGVINVIRAGIAARYLRHRPAAGAIGPWRRLVIVGHTLGGGAWGVLIMAAILHATLIERLSIYFLVSLLTTFQAVAPGTFPAAFHAYLAAALLPPLLTTIWIDADRGRLLIAFFLVFAFAVSRIGRQSHRLAAEGVRQRLENTRLLADLTAQKDALDQANRAKTHFLAAASHDLRQPLQALVLNTENLENRIREPEARPIAASIRSSVKTLANLLNAILDISKFDAGTVRPQRDHFRITQILALLAEAFAPEAARKGLSLKVRPSDAVVETDPVLLYRILSNLVANAVRYTSQGGIVVGCRKRRGSLAIECWDTGIGIEPGQQRLIFGEFYQVANPERDREQGLGLGLTIVQRTAEVLGHPVRVLSRVGRGSMFSITVPLGDSARMRAATHAGDAELAGCRVLVVEDEEQVRAALVTMLQDWGCVVRAAGSSAKAQALVFDSGEVPDIVIADYRLPGGETGIDVIRALSSLPPYPSGILVTGDIAPEVLRRAEESGYTLLHKPLRPARLRALLGSFWRARAGGERDAQAEPH